MTDAEILAAASARYEAFREVFPKVLETMETATNLRRDQMGIETRVRLIGFAADATARLVTGDVPAPRS